MESKKIVFIFLLMVVSLSAFSQEKQLLDSLTENGDKAYKDCNYPEAIRYYQSAVSVAKTGRGNSPMPLLYGKIGNVYEDMSHYDKAIKYYQMSYDIYSWKNDSIGVAGALNQTGNIYYRWGNMKLSLMYYEQALDIQKIKNDKHGMNSTLNNIGNIYYAWQNFDKALQSYFEVLKIKEQLRDSTELVNNLINIGSAYLGLKDYKKAKEYYRQALLLTQKNNDKNMEANCLLNMGVLAFEQGQYPEAIANYNKAYGLLSNLKNKFGMAMVFRNLAETMIKTGDLSQAKNYLHKALTLAKVENMTSLMAECYYLYSEIYRKRNDYRHALETYMKYNTLNDSVFNEKARQQLSNLEARYETEKKEKEIQLKTQQIARKEKQIEQQRVLFMLLSGIIILIGLFVIYFLRNKARIKQKSLEEEISRQRQQALSAQMNPHFISNALNSIQKYFLANDIEKANEFLADFGALIRKVLENSHENLIPLHDELDYLKLYIALENLRLDGKFLFEINLSKVDTDNILIPPLIVQPYVENAIWHGIVPLQEQGKILIQLTVKENKLICVIEDNGIGINRSKSEKLKYKRQRKSLAMDITKERLRLLNQSTQIQFAVTISDLSDSNPDIHGTKVEIQMPLIYG